MTEVTLKDNIIWTDDFLIGIEELDYEHRLLIKDINFLHQEMLEQDSKEKIERTLGDILARMQSHFALEEHFMLENKYPHYIEHKAEHNELLDEYTDLMISFNSKGATADYLKIEQNLRRWIVDHIIVYDKKMSWIIK